MLEEAGFGRGEAERPSGIVEPRRPSAEAVTSEMKSSEEALERRTRRTHCGRPRGSPAGAEIDPSGELSDFACIQRVWPRSFQLVIDHMRHIWPIGGSGGSICRWTGHAVDAVEWCWIAVRP